ncbi:MAG: hypothetical protein IJH12_10200 [Clostridia bacterium]|nr:hypothetical protein [Clostridia bacterium]
MSELSKKYQEIISELDSRIRNKDELIFVKDKISEISIIFIDLIEKISGVVEDKISGIESSQQQIEKKISNIESSVNSIKEDIYEEDKETEIICPYCNSEFYAEISEETESEIECPECHNIIELDMNSENIENDLYGIHNCGGQCGGCSGCGYRKNKDNK